MKKFISNSVNVSIYTDNIDETAYNQIIEITKNKACENDVAIMPDVHAGSGIVIGFTMKMNDKIVPDWIGVDINCGVIFSKTNIVDFEKFDTFVRKTIPSGKNIHDVPIVNFKEEFRWDFVNEQLKKFTEKYNETFGTKYIPIEYDYDWFKNKCSEIKIKRIDAERAIGTLGGGNHFISIEQDVKSADKYMVIHTGSRNFGKRICDYHNSFIEKSNSKNIKNEFFQKGLKEILNDENNKKQRSFLISKLKNEIENSEIGEKDYLEGDYAYNYLVDMIFAQEYANFNRRTIVYTLNGMGCDFNETNHNFIDFDDFVIRKGAVRSYKNELFIIPINMRDGSLLCVGKGNERWNNSAPHGAGRIMSRREAVKKIDYDKYVESMKGIVSSSVNINTLDESPFAYKNIDEIKKNIEETCDIVSEIKPLYNFKDS